MKILIPTVDYPPIEGGIGTVALHVSRELAALGHDVTVVAPAVAGRDMAGFDAAEPVTVVRFGGYEWGWFRLFPLLRRALPLTRETDLILAINITYGGLIGLFARVLRGVPYVTFAYAFEFLKFAHTPVIARVLRTIYRHAAFTAAISRFTQSNLIRFGVAEDRIERILPGAPESREPSLEAVEEVRRRFLPDAGPLILAVGRFIPRKGQEQLVRAMPEILEACPNTHLVMAGRGPTLAACLERTRALGIEGHVDCPGFLEDDLVAALYRECSLFVLPTGRDAHGQVEGFGLVFSEAHAYGKAVAAGRSGGVTDAVIHGETGLLVDPEDYHALAAAVIRLLRNPDEAQRMGEAGRRRIEEELNWKTFTGKLMACLEKRKSA
jgi:phosphatidyl-myo-inositol dimannoside synthase